MIPIPLCIKFTCTKSAIKQLTIFFSAFFSINHLKELRSAQPSLKQKNDTDKVQKDTEPIFIARCKHNPPEVCKKGLSENDRLRSWCHKIA